MESWDTVEIPIETPSSLFLMLCPWFIFRVNSIRAYAFSHAKDAVENIPHCPTH